MRKPAQLTEQQLMTALSLSRQLGRLATLHKARTAIHRRLSRLDRQITSLEAEITATVAIGPEQLDLLLAQHGSNHAQPAAQIARHEKSKQRHTPKEKSDFLLACLRLHQKLHPSDEAVRLEWIRKQFEERFTLRPIGNATIYFNGVIDKSWFRRGTNTRNRAVDLKKAMRGLGASI